eukprot:GEMP01019612.1.p1 GENE.GEMP01019612.1~~GEMP01019612.1.p1  ORF type:complete len:569 (+),score=50.78 GEMP01019612.1:166-1872(+)
MRGFKRFKPTAIRAIYFVIIVYIFRFYAGYHFVYTVLNELSDIYVHGFTFRSMHNSPWRNSPTLPDSSTEVIFRRCSHTYMTDWVHNVNNNGGLLAPHDEKKEWQLGSLSQFFTDFAHVHTLDHHKTLSDSERAQVGWLMLRVWFAVFFAFHIYYCRLVQRFVHWARTEMIPLLSVPYNFSLLCFDAALVSAVAIESAQLTIALLFLNIAFATPSPYRVPLVAGSRRTILTDVGHFLGSLCFLLVFLVLEGGLILFASVVNPHRRSMSTVYDAGRELLHSMMPSLECYSDYYWRPADGEYFALPVLYLLVINLVCRYPSGYFVYRGTIALPEVAKCVTTITIAHTFWRPFLFCISNLPSQLPDCYNRRFAHIDTIDKILDRFRDPLKLFRGGCNDLLPSGHVIIVTLCCLIISKYRGGWPSWFMWFNAVYSFSLVVLEGWHYTIDIIAAFFISALVWYLVHGELCWMGHVVPLPSRDSDYHSASNGEGMFKPMSNGFNHASDLENPCVNDNNGYEYEPRTSIPPAITEIMKIGATSGVMAMQEIAKVRVSIDRLLQKANSSINSGKNV